MPINAYAAQEQASNDSKAWDIHNTEHGSGPVSEGTTLSKTQGTLENAENIIGNDDRVLVENTEVAPFKSIVFLNMVFEEGGEEKNYRGSGCLIDEDTVLTSAHCLYDLERGWAKEVTVYPGQTELKTPYGSAVASRLIVPNNWTSNEETSDDIGIIKLEKPIGYKTGTLSLSKSLSTSTQISISGYPSDVQTVTRSHNMWTISGSIKSLTQDFIYYDLDSTGGQSGSPIYNQSNQVVGVHGYGSDTGNFGVRINDEKYSTISSWNMRTQSVFRLYNPNSGEHYYTAKGKEVYSLMSAGWIYENCAWFGNDAGYNVYQLYNPNAGDHLFTMNENERTFLENSGWLYEGIAWGTDLTGYPVYRLYNPNATTGSHLYTISEEEKDYLVSTGWQNDGIVFYGN